MTKTPTVQRCVTIGKNLQSVVEMRLWEGFLIRLKESEQKKHNYCSEYEGVPFPEDSVYICRSKVRTTSYGPNSSLRVVCSAIRDHRVTKFCYKLIELQLVISTIQKLLVYVCATELSAVGWCDFVTKLGVPR